MKALSLLGIISYELYLFHQPLVTDMNMALYHTLLGIPVPENHQVAATVVVGLAAAVAISVVVHLAVSWAFSFFRKRPAPGPAGARA
jgi:peptidoglycan/LPS O-acetylase OafA/YrhL